MDWSASASAPWAHDLVPGQIVLDKSYEVLRDVTLPSTVSYWKRLDGIFAFGLSVQESEHKELSDKDLVRLAAAVSTQIKAQEGYQNKSISASLVNLSKYHDSFPSITVSPIKLDTNESFNEEELKNCLEHDEKLLALKARRLGKRLQREKEAIFVLRRQFASAFEKAYAVKAELRSQMVRNPLRRLLGGEHLFRKYTWHAPMFGYFMLIGLFGVWDLSKFINQERGVSNAKDLAVQATNSFFESILSIGLPFFLLTLVLVVLIRRNKTIVAIDKALTILMFGNIYCGVVCDIVGRVNGHTEKINFDSAIQALEDTRRIEKEKKVSNLALLTAAMAICYVPFMQLVEQTAPHWVINIAGVMENALTAPFSRD